MHNLYKSRAHNEYKKAVGFGVFLAIVLCSLILFSISSADRIILGSELNGNGTVEYLCLGSSCDGLTRMDW